MIDIGEHHQIQRSERHRSRHIHLTGAEGATGGLHSPPTLATQRSRAQVKDAAEAVAAESCGDGPPVDVDALHASHGKGAQIDAATSGSIQRDPIEIDLHLIRGGSADRDGTGTA